MTREALTLALEALKKTWPPYPWNAIDPRADAVQAKQKHEQAIAACEAALAENEALRVPVLPAGLTDEQDAFEAWWDAESTGLGASHRFTAWNAWKARAILAAAVPAGWVAVPVEPTEAMKIAGDNAPWFCADKYRAMLSARPGALGEG